MASALERSPSLPDRDRDGIRPIIMPPRAEAFQGSVERVRIEVIRRYRQGQLVEERFTQDVHLSPGAGVERPTAPQRRRGNLLRAAGWLFSSYSEAKEVLGDLWSLVTGLV